MVSILAALTRQTNTEFLVTHSCTGVALVEAAQRPTGTLAVPVRLQCMWLQHSMHAIERHEALQLSGCPHGSSIASACQVSGCRGECVLTDCWVIHVASCLRHEGICRLIEVIVGTMCSTFRVFMQPLKTPGAPLAVRVRVVPCSAVGCGCRCHCRCRCMMCRAVKSCCESVGRARAFAACQANLSCVGCACGHQALAVPAGAPLWGVASKKAAERQQATAPAAC